MVSRGGRIRRAVQSLHDDRCGVQSRRRSAAGRDSRERGPASPPADRDPDRVAWRAGPNGWVATGPIAAPAFPARGWNTVTDMLSIECQDLHHSYDGVHDALRGLSLRVAAGEVLALIGPNGAGKSTALRILATLLQPDRGRVLWDGHDAWADRYTVRPRIGFLGDGTALYAGMTAAGYLRFFAECYGQADRAVGPRVAELLAQFDLTTKADTAIADLSKGMRQRLAIARALVHRPQLLLLDEPADGLDPAARRQLRAILRQTADGGVGVVISSHILRELDGFCDAVAVMQKGRLEVFGTVDEVIERYEVSRRVHRIEVLRGIDRALKVLAGHRGLVERVERRPEAADAGVILVRIHGDSTAPAKILRELVAAEVDVLALHRVRSDLEDVYQSLGHEQVS
ncbi:MAG: ABC transporter ATP-binding protein [Myxococcales bacterium FL481]|nr:MAG: ABC transporter ATP-binding protein [Myxococcales bacterium FL481]